LVNENIYEIISLINEIEILNFIFVCWMPKKNYECNFFPFSPSISNKVMMYGHTLCFLKNKLRWIIYFIKYNKNYMVISKNSPIWEIQEVDDIYLWECLLLQHLLAP